MRRQLEELKAGIEQLKTSLPDVKFWIGVMTRMNGLGDWLLGCAFARAAKRYWMNEDAEFVLRHAGLDLSKTAVLVLGDACPMPTDFDISVNQPGIDRMLRVPTSHWLPRALAAQPHFDVFYEVQPVVRTSFRDRKRFAVEQAEADARLDYWRCYYDGFPESCPKLTRLGLSQWDILSNCAGFPVTPDDLTIPTTPPKIEGVPRRTRADLDAYAGCVTIHNGQGQGTGTKMLPPDVPAEIARALNRRRIQVVQLGVRHNGVEPPIQGAVDLRGLRINESAHVIENAQLHVDCEGGLVVIARAVGTRSVAFFGPTSPDFYGFAENVNYSRAICPEPVGPHCNWSCPDWSERCRLGFDHCVNFPQPETAARVVLDALDARDEVPMRDQGGWLPCSS